MPIDKMIKERGKNVGNEKVKEEAKKHLWYTCCLDTAGAKGCVKGGAVHVAR